MQTNVQTGCVYSTFGKKSLEDFQLRDRWTYIFSWSCWLLRGEWVLEARVTAGRSLRSYCGHIWVREEGGSAWGTLELERSGHTWSTFWRCSRQDSLMRLTWACRKEKNQECLLDFWLETQPGGSAIIWNVGPGERTGLEGLGQHWPPELPTMTECSLPTMSNMVAASHRRLLYIWNMPAHLKNCLLHLTLINVNSHMALPYWIAQT